MGCRGRGVVSWGGEGGGGSIVRCCWSRFATQPLLESADGYEEMQILSVAEKGHVAFVIKMVGLCSRGMRFEVVRNN